MRKFAWSAFSFAAAILICHYVVPSSVRLWLLLPLFAIGACACFLRNHLRTRILLFCAFAVIGILRYDVHCRINLGLEDSLDGNEYRITAYVSEFPVIYDDYSKITVQLRTDLLPQVKTVLYDYDNNVRNLSPGDMIRTTVKFTSASVSSGEETDTYISKGIYLRGTVRDEIKEYDTWWGKYVYFPKYISREIQELFDVYIPKREAAFMKALVTGEKKSLYDTSEVYHVLQKAGLSHVVAVSGMHLSFLVGMILMLFGSRIGWIASLLSIVVFAFMTGLSPSVLRAAFMQMLYLLAPVLRREADGITSIAFALIILLMMNPFAVASISLQLSFAAILGIHLITPKALEWFAVKGTVLKGFAKKAYLFMSSSLSAALGASLFTVPLCAIYFGSISIFAPLANLFVLWIIPACFGLGFLLCFAALVSGKLAAVLGSLLSILIQVIYVISACIANLPCSNLYLPPIVMLLALICIYGVLGITYFMKGDTLYRPLLPMAVIIVILFSLVGGVKWYYTNGTTVAAIDVGQGQCIAILDESNTILIDCGGTYEAGQTVVNWLNMHGRNQVDCLILTHFDKDHTNGIEDLLIQTDVKEIKFCSLNLTEFEYGILRRIQTLSEEKGALLSPINHSSETMIGNINIEFYVPTRTEGNNGLMLLASVDAFDMLITGDADLETENEMMRFVSIPDGECIVAGHHGSKYSTGDRLLYRFKPEVCFISCGYNSYGHPSEEVLDRLQKRNVVIYRTDELGSIEIKVR